LQSAQRLPGASTPAGMLAWLTAATIVLYVAAWLCRMAQWYVKTGLGTRMTYDLGADLFDHLQRLSLRFHGARPTGDLVHRVTSDAGSLREPVAHVVSPLFTSLVRLAGLLGRV